MPRLAALSGDRTERGRVLRRLAREYQRLRAPGRSSRRLAMHVEVCLYLTALFLEEHRQQEAWAEPAPERGEKPCSSAGTKLRRRMAMRREEAAPDYYVPIFNVREPRIDVLLLGVGLGGG